MYGRIVAPALVAVGVWLGTVLVSTGSALLTRNAVNLMVQGVGGAHMAPVVPDLHWLVFGAVFVAVHLCAKRGGSRRECLLVGLAPAIVGVVAYGALLLRLAGPWAFLYGIGLVDRVTTGMASLGTVIAVRGYLADLLGVVAACLASVWLYFFAADRLTRSASHVVAGP